LTHRLEAEHAVLMAMIQPGRTAVDVGANLGVYTYGFLECGANVVAIEPQPSCAALIRAFYQAGWPRSKHRGSLDLRIEAIGATTGTATLHVPIKEGRVDHESASFDNAPVESIEIAVPVRRLDEYGLNDVSVIKIDVEGNEVSAIEGAAGTIRRWRPAMLIEIEQRHHKDPISTVFSRLVSIAGAGYEISFLGKDRRLHPLAEFNVERDQLSLVDNPLSPRYVRNFFILPSGP
jgi:FkbM family methyltransferase